MISSEDALYTYEYPEHFKILPAIHNWSADPFRIKDGRRCPRASSTQAIRTSTGWTSPCSSKWIDANRSRIGQHLTSAKPRPRELFKMRVLYVRDAITAHDRRFLKAIIEQGHQPIVALIGEERVPEASTDLGAITLSAARTALGSIAAEYETDLAHVGPVPTVAAVAAEHLPRRMPFVVVSWGCDVLRDCDAEEVRQRGLLSHRSRQCGARGLRGRPAKDTRLASGTRNSVRIVSVGCRSRSLQRGK